jgi:pimeloyl-ACP methyl ester carboxylesterase
MITSARRSLVIVVFLIVSAAVPVRAAPRLPELFRDALTRMGVAPDGVQAMIDATLGNPEAPQPTDPRVAARMDLAREQDVVVDDRVDLFDSRHVQLGIWRASDFLRDYGTALLLTAPYDDRRTPVFLVHGINGSPRDFAPVVSRFRGSRYQPVVFYYPTGMPLADASRELGTRMQEFLERHPTNGFAVVGHSMGGLVAKGLLDQFDVARLLPAWKAFVGMSCPWSGVAAASQAKRLPVHPASWDDLAPTSTFVHRVNTTPFPPSLAFYMFFGARGGRSMFSVLGNHDGRLTVDSMMDTPLAEAARDTFGFYEDHVSILAAPRVLARLETVLDQELGNTRQERRPRPNIPGDDDPRSARVGPD